MVHFEFLDWFWLIAFILLMVGSGILFYRLGKRSESDFFLAIRGLPWWLPASSVYATHTATDEFNSPLRYNVENHKSQHSITSDYNFYRFSVRYS